MDPIKSIGQKLQGGEQRDAIHIAILPCIAADELSPGQQVGLVYGTQNQVKAKDKVYGLNPIGVVDPFLNDMWIKKGDRIWVFLFPGTITGLRHEWTHPALDNQQPAKNESEEWLRGFADKWNFQYDEMIAQATYKEGYIVAGGIDLHSRTELEAGDEDLFWQHIQNLTGFRADTEHREKFGWSCSC